MSDGNDPVRSAYGCASRSTRGVALAVAVAFLGASVGTSQLAFAQAKKPPATKPAAPAAKAPAGDKKAAGAAFKKGKEAFEKKDYKEAKSEFMKAEEIIPAAAAEYYIARSHEELGESAEAASWFQKAIDSGKLKDDQAADAKSRLEALKKKPAKVKITSEPAGATIMIDGKAITDKTPAEVELAPGPHKITIQAEGKKDATQDVDVVAFVGANVSTTLEAAPPAAPAEDPFAKKKDETPPPPPAAPATPAPAPDGKRDMTWVYITGGAAIVALGVGTFFGVKALDSKKKFDANPTRDTRDSGTRNALISDMGFGIGITLAVTCAVLYFTNPSEPEAAAPAKTSSVKPHFSFAPIIGAPTGGGGLSMAGGAAHFEF